MLKIISRKPIELQAVFNTLLERAARLCEAETGIISLTKDGYYYFEATYGTSPEFNTFVANHPAEINRGTGMGRALVDAKTVHITDVLADADYKYFEGQRLGGFRALLSVPLLSEGTPIGVIGLGRRAVRSFTDKQIELVTTFADQAVIAIENARLFSETKEALERQTATSDILKVIAGSPDDVKPVLEVVADRAMILLNCWSVVVTRYDGELIHFGAARGALLDTEPYVRNLYPSRPQPDTHHGRCILERKAISISDAQDDPNPTNGERV